MRGEGGNRLARAFSVLLVLSSVGLGAAACGGGTDAASSTTSTTTYVYHDPQLRSYLSESADSVYFLQLQENQDTGILEQLLAPSIAPDHQFHDWVYRLMGTASGNTLTYHLTVVSPGAPSLPQTMTAQLTGKSVVLGPPFGSAVVLRTSTQQLYDTAARTHMKIWTGSSGS